MLTTLVVPTLICGYLLITSLPRERYRISLYKGWSLYLRAGAYGLAIVASNFIAFAVILPGIGNLIGKVTGLHLLPDTDLLKALSSYLLDYFSITKNNSSYFISAIAFSLSATSLATTFIFAAVIYFKNMRGELSLLNERQILITLQDKAPIEYQLLSISRRLKQDNEINEGIKRERKDLAREIKASPSPTSKDGRQKTLADIHKANCELKYIELTYAQITLDSDKFYIGSPLVVPPPDEDGIQSSGILIIPVASGFRDENKKLKIITEYDFDLNETDPKDCIALTRDNIVSVSGFTRSTYKRLNP